MGSTSCALHQQSGRPEQQLKSPMPLSSAHHLPSGTLPCWNEAHWCHASAGSGYPNDSNPPPLRYNCLFSESCHQSRVCPWALLNHSAINLRRLNNEHEAPAIWGISFDHHNCLSLYTVLTEPTLCFFHKSRIISNTSYTYTLNRCVIPPYYFM